MKAFLNKIWEGIKKAVVFGYKKYEENPEAFQKAIEEGKKIINKE